MINSSGDLKLNSQTSKDIKDALNLFGFKLGHSIEYNFNEQLSLSADVGLNWIFWDISQSTESMNDYYINKTKTELKTNLSLTYSKLSINFKL